MLQKLIAKLDRFNYTKTGLVVGFLLGLTMTAMGIVFVVTFVNRKDYSTAWLTSIVMLIGLLSIAVDVYRARKVLKAK